MISKYKILFLLIFISVNVSYGQLFEFYISESSSYLDKGNTDQAKYYANKAIKKDSMKSDGYYFLALAYLEEENFEDALTNLNNAESHNPKSIQILKLLAEVHDRISNFQYSYEYYNKYLKLDSSNLSVLSDKAWIACKLDRYEESESILNKVLQFDSLNTDALNIYGLLRENQKNYIEAIKYYSLVIEIDPNYAPAYYNRCRNHAFLKNKKENCADCKKAIELGIQDAMLFILDKKKCK